MEYTWKVCPCAEFQEHSRNNIHFTGRSPGALWFGTDKTLDNMSRKKQQSLEANNNEKTFAKCLPRCNPHGKHTTADRI